MGQELAGDGQERANAVGTQLLTFSALEDRVEPLAGAARTSAVPGDAELDRERAAFALAVDTPTTRGRAGIEKSLRCGYG